MMSGVMGRAQSPPTSMASTTSPPSSPPSPSALLADFVSLSLSSHLSGDRRSYETLVSQLSSSFRSADSAASARWLAALSTNSSRLAVSSHHFAALLQLLLGLPLAGMTLTCLRLYTDLLIDLSTTASPTQHRQVEAACAQLVRTFTVTLADTSAASASGPEDGHQPPATTSSQPLAVDLPATVSQLLDSVHRTLHKLVRLSPGCLSVLWLSLVDAFPSPRQSSADWLSYVQQLLRVAEYAPTLRERILSCVVERLTHLDVELATQQQQLTDRREGDGTSEAEGGEGIGEDGEDEGVEEEGEGASDASLLTLVDRRLLQSDEAQRLDAVLSLLLRYLRLLSTSSHAASTAPSPSSSPSPPSPFSLCDDVFYALLRSFSTSIARTVDCRCVQFLLFYQTSLRHVYAETFLRYLIDRMFDPSADVRLRLSSVDYLQSFLARAAFLRQASAMVAFTSVLHWTVGYADEFHRRRKAELRGHSQAALHRPPFAPSVAELPPVDPLEAAPHCLFYRSFQLLLYVFIYRWRAFEGEMDANATAKSLLPEGALGGGGEGVEVDEEEVEAARQALLDEGLTRPRLRSLLRFLVQSPLDPLRYCQPFIVKEFSRIARATALLDLTPLLTRQQRRRRREERGRETSAVLSVAHSALNNGSGLLGSTAESEARELQRGDDSSPSALSASFPFDPFFLPHFAHFLQPLYAHYEPEHIPPPTSTLTPRAIAAREKRKSFDAANTHQHDGGSPWQSSASHYAGQEPSGSDWESLRRRQRRREAMEEEKEDGEAAEPCGGEEGEGEEGEEGEEEDDGEPSRLVQPNFSPGFGPTLTSSPLAPPAQSTVSTSSSASSFSSLSPLPPAAVRRPFPLSSSLPLSRLPAASLTAGGAAGTGRTTELQGRSLARFTVH